MQHQQKLEQIGESLESHQLPPEIGDRAADQPTLPVTPKSDELKARERARQSLVEQKIQQAMAAGAFDNLPGKGKPLNLKKNPYSDSANELAFDLLQNNQLAPEWIERDKEIRRELEAARATLQAAWQSHQLEPARWESALADFTQRLEKLNRKIDDFNLIAPVLSVQRARLRLENELRRLES